MSDKITQLEEKIKVEANPSELVNLLNELSGAVRSVDINRALKLAEEAKKLAAVGVKAIEQGIARRNLTRKQIYDEAMVKIKAARDHTKLMMDKGVIPKAPI